MKLQHFSNVNTTYDKHVNRYLGIAGRSKDSILSDLSPAVVLWKPDRVSWNTICLHTTSEKPTAAQNINGTLHSQSCRRCGRDAILTMTKGTSPMLVKLQTADYLIYAELDKAERVTHLASEEPDSRPDVLCDFA